jgi:hypothetical protein
MYVRILLYYFTVQLSCVSAPLESQGRKGYVVVRRHVYVCKVLRARRHACHYTYGGRIQLDHRTVPQRSGWGVQCVYNQADHCRRRSSSTSAGRPVYHNASSALQPIQTLALDPRVTVEL